MKCYRAALTAVLLAVVTSAVAQDYPNKPVRILVGFTPGTAIDIMARIVGAKLTEKWGRQVVVENRDGAAGTISAGLAARANADGYTLYIASATFIITPLFIKDLPYDPLIDFAPVIHLATIPTVLVVNPQVAVNSVKDLIEMAKARPGVLNYASSGKGTASDLSAEMLRKMSGINLAEVPYKASSQALSAAVSGEVSLYFPSLPAALPMIRQGRLKGLAVTGVRRVQVAPDIPALAETLPGYDAANWYGIVVPAKTPRAIIEKIYRDVAQIMDLPDIKERMPGLGAELQVGDAADLKRKLLDEAQRWTVLLKK